MAERNPPPPTDPSPDSGIPRGNLQLDASASAQPQTAKPPAAKKRRRRRWPYVLLILVLLLGLLIVLLPTLAGTGPVRSVILGQVNQRLNGRVEVADLSLGWISPVKVSGLKVFDKAGVQVLELPKLTTGLKLLDAVRGRLHFGKVTVEGLNALIRRDADGTINLAELLPPSTTPAPDDTGPTKLPDVSGELHLVNCRATFEDKLQGQTFFFPMIAGTVKCPDVNGVIENALDVECKVGDARPGKLTVAGRADVADGNVISIETMDVEQKVTIRDVELGSFAFALGKDAALQKLAGLTSGAVSLRYRGGDGAGVEAQITSTGFAAGGPALKGDTFATQTLSLTVPPTTLSMPAGSSDWKTWSLRVGSTGAAGAIALAIDQGTVKLAADAPLRALSNLGDNLPPGAQGQIRADVDLDVASLARQMPHVLALQEGLTLTSGRLVHVADVRLQPDRATVQRLETNLVDVRGQRGGQVISLQPINLLLTGSSLGGGWVAPNVRDLNFTLASGFANAAFSGQDLAALSGTATGDLKRLRDELGQVFDLGDLQLAGPFDIQLSSKGDVATGGNAVVSTTVTVTDLLFGTAEDKAPLRQSRVRLEAGGELMRRPDGSVDQVRGGRIVLDTGDAARPTVAARVSIPTVAMVQPAPAAPTPAGSSAPTPATQPASGVASAAYEVTRLAVDLAKAKAEFGDYLPGLREYAFDRGALNVTGGGKYENGALTYDGKVVVSDLTLARTPQPAAGAPAAPPAGRVEVVRGYNLTTDAALAYTPQGGGGATLDVTRLAVTDDRKMLSLVKAADQPLRVVTTAGGSVPSGKLDLAIDLKQLNDVRDRLAATTPAAPGARATGLRSGRLAGTVDFAQAAQGEMRIATQLEGTGLTVSGPGGQALDNERIGIVAQARAKSDFSAAFVDKLDVTGNLLTANVSGTALQLTVGQGDAARAATTVEMIQSATVKAEIPDLGKLQTLLDAMAAPDAPATARLLSPVETPDRKLPIFGRSGGASAQVVFAQARQAPPSEQVIGRRPQPAPSRQTPPAPRQGERALPQGAIGESEAPAPPVKLTGGSASLSVVVKKDGDRTVVTPEVTGKNVSLAKGAGSHTLDALEFKTELSFVPVAPPATARVAPGGNAPTPAAASEATGDDTGPSIAEQIRDLRIPNFTLRGAGSTISLVEPVSVSDVGALGRLLAPKGEAPGAAARPVNAGDVKAAVRAEGDVGQLSALLVALGIMGDPAGPKQPYGGRYDLEQRLTAGDNGVGATGKLNLNDFVVAGSSSFNEKAIRFANDITLDAAKDALALRDVSLAMESTKALELKLAGNVLEYSTKRRFENVAGTIGYDWAKLWEIVRPMLSKEQQESLKLRVAGQAQRQFALGGSYPAVGDDGQPLPYYRAIQFLTGHFEGGFQLVEINGLEVQNLELPLTLADGKLVVAYHDKPEGQNLPAAADCNSGKLDIGGAVVDLTGEAPRLTLAKGTKLLVGATLNPVFSDMFGGIINNPLFVSPTEARGLVDITVVECDRLPLDTLVLKAARENDGRAEFLFSIKEVFLGNSTLLEGLKLAGQSEFAKSLQGEIRESRVIIERGQTRQDVTINTGAGDRPFRIAGSTALETKRLNLTLTIPPQLLRQLGPQGRQAAELLADGLPIPLGGTTRAPQLDLNRAFTTALKEGLLPGLLRRATGGDRNTAPGANPPPARDGDMQPGDRSADGTKPPPTTEPPAGADPIKDLFDLVGKQRQQKEKEKQDERDRRRRERERQQGTADPAEARPAGGSDRIGRQAPRRDRNR